MNRDILERLRIDPGQRTLGQLIQDREAAAQEIVRLRGARAGRPHATASPQPMPLPAKREDDGGKPPFRAGALLRVAEVCELLALSRATVYKLRAEGAFPEPLRLASRAVRWRVDDLVTWCESRRR